MRKTLSIVLAALLVLSLCSTGFAYSDKLNEPGVLPLVNTDVTIVIGTPAVATITDYDDNHLTNWWREKTGIDIQVYLFDNSEYKSQFQLMTSAGEKLPDTLVNFGFTALERESYGTQEYLVNVLPYFEDGTLTYWYENEAITYLNDTEKATTLTAGLSSDGALYSFPFWAVSVPDPWSDGFLINNTFCEALGMDIPTTIDEFYDYLVAVKTQDPNGNGLNDEIPLVGFANTSNGDPIINILNSFLYYPASWSGLALCATDDGTIYAPYYQQDAFHEGLAFVAKLYAEGLISDQSFSQDRYGLQAMIDLTGEENPDIVGAAVSHRSYMFADHNHAERRPHYTTIGPLVGPEGVAFAPTSKVEPTYRDFITTDCENPDVAFAMFDFMTSTESTLVARYGRENQYWHWATEEEKANGSAYAEVGYTDVLYSTSGNEICWGQQTNEIWNITCFTWQPQGFTAIIPANHYEDPIYEYNVTDWNGGVMLRYGKAPANLIGTLPYSAEELETIGTRDTDIGKHVRESMTRFVVGELDINGADYDTFQSELEMLGIQEILACAQAAYDRTK